MSMKTDEIEAAVKQGRGGLVVGIVVLVGIALLGAGVFLVVTKRKGAGATPEVPVSAGIVPWCKLRQEWKQTVLPLDGDLMVKAAAQPDAQETKDLLVKRNTACQTYAKRLRELLQGDATLFSTVAPVEETLVKEGKTRSNLAVKIANQVNAEIPKAPDTETLERIRKVLAVEIVQEIQAKKAEYDRDLDAAQKKAGACAGIYRGTMTDEGTSGNPYVTWDEIEVQRTLAAKVVGDRIKEIEPLEAFYNRVRHDLMARHGKELTRCYDRTRRANPKIPDRMGLKIRLTKDGKVKGLNFGWSNGMDEKILDCLAEGASKWKLPEPISETDEALVTVDFSKM